MDSTTTEVTHGAAVEEVTLGETLGVEEHRMATEVRDPDKCRMDSTTREVQIRVMAEVEEEEVSCQLAKESIYRLSSLGLYDLADAMDNWQID